jgi:hypothetical protein
VRVPEGVVRDYFCRAATHCVHMMRLPGSSQGPRVVDIELSVSGNGNAQVDSYRPRPPQVHSGKPSLVAYLQAMWCVIAFGTSDAIDTMAGYSAGDCQIEGLVVGRSVYDSMAGSQRGCAAGTRKPEENSAAPCVMSTVPETPLSWPLVRVTPHVFCGTLASDSKRTDASTWTSRWTPMVLCVCTHSAFVAWHRRLAYRRWTLHFFRCVSWNPFRIAS